jgi:hypothetical protein
VKNVLAAGPPLIHVNAMPHIYEKYENTPLWRAIAGALKELEASGEIKIETAPTYVVGYICQELSAKQIVADSSLRRAR